VIASICGIVLALLLAGAGLVVASVGYAFVEMRRWNRGPLEARPFGAQMKGGA